MKQQAISSLFQQTKHYSRKTTHAISSISAAKNHHHGKVQCLPEDDHSINVDLNAGLSKPAGGKSENNNGFVKAGGHGHGHGHGFGKIKNKEVGVENASTAVDANRVTTENVKSFSPLKNLSRKQTEIRKGLNSAQTQAQQNEDSTAAADTLSILSQDQQQQQQQIVTQPSETVAQVVKSKSQVKKETEKNVEQPKQSSKKRHLKEATKDQSEVQLSPCEQQSSSRKHKRMKSVKRAAPYETIQETKKEHLVSPASSDSQNKTKSLASLKNLSKTTQDQIAKLLKKTRPQPQQNEEKKQELTQSPVNEVPLQEKRQQVLIPQTSTSSSQGISHETLDLIKKLRTQGTNSISAQRKVSPVPHLLAEKSARESGNDSRPSEMKSRISAIESGNSISSQGMMRSKHAELLKVKRELVLPLHMKTLIEYQRFIDESLIFIKRCRKQQGYGVIYFTEVKESVQKSFGRSLDVGIFRQLLQIIPEMYRHSWEKPGGQKQHQLAIEFGEEQEGKPLFGFFQKRQEVLKGRLRDLCLEAYKEKMRDYAERITDEHEAALIADPLKYQMWHHTFDPHTMVPSVKQAQLSSPPQVLRSSSMNTFMEKSGNVTATIIKDAIEKSKNEAKEVQQTETVEQIKTRERLENLSKETGISVETLKLIKSVETKVNEKRAKNMEVVHAEEGRKQMHILVGLASQVRYLFQMKRANTMQMNVLVQQICEKPSNGEFFSKQDRAEQVEKLAKLCPKWLMVRQMASVGKIVKVNQAIPQLTVKQQIEDAIEKENRTVPGDVTMA